ncbi:hypothetical protein ACIBI9_65510 [Nonomuraea sp. NPDC050451]|uniref:hypothetical protein n=1 Tax=Nonomuraea sp. NPDC050451 TaxID=3364364 RepID=UPI0037AB6B4B
MTGAQPSGNAAKRKACGNPGACRPRSPTLNGMTADHGQGADVANALQNACERFATHLTLLNDQLRGVELTEDDQERIEVSATRAFTAVVLVSAMTKGTAREAEGDGTCPHFNALTDAEWAGLQSMADRTAVPNRSVVYECELEAGHPGPHLALAQAWCGDDDVWPRLERAVRELTGLAPCPAAGEPADDLADDPEESLLFDGHPGEHSFDRAVVIAGIRSEASPPRCWPGWTPCWRTTPKLHDHRVHDLAPGSRESAFEEAECRNWRSEPDLRFGSMTRAVRPGGWGLLPPSSARRRRETGVWRQRHPARRGDRLQVTTRRDPKGEW